MTPPPPSRPLSQSLSPPTLLLALISRTRALLLESNLVADTTTGPALDSRSFSLPPSKLSRRSTTEIPLPMLPLAETEKLIREKDEEVSKHLTSPALFEKVPLWPWPAPSPAILPRTAASHARDAGEDAGPDAAEPGSRGEAGRPLRPPPVYSFTLAQSLVRLLSNSRAPGCLAA